MDVGFLPTWAVLLEAAGYDPLRAAEMEEKLTREWYNRYVFVHGLRAERAKKDMR